MHDFRCEKSVMDFTWNTFGRTWNWILLLIIDFPCHRLLLYIQVVFTIGWHMWHKHPQSVINTCKTILKREQIPFCLLINPGFMQYTYSYFPNLWYTDTWYICTPKLILSHFIVTLQIIFASVWISRSFKRIDESYTYIFLNV